MKKPKVAVIAHQQKGDLDELRRAITAAGVTALRWHEVPRSKKAGRQARRAVKDGANLIFVSGGDGMVQHCADALAGTKVPIAIIPAGTANLLAANLGISKDVAKAVDIGLHGARRRLDLGRINGEHFVVMAGAGFDAEMIDAADRGLKDRLGRLAYLWTGLQQVQDKLVPTTIRVDNADWFTGDASCVLFGNIGTITGGVEAFPDARPDDGWLEVGVATAHGVLEWSRTLGQMAAGDPDKSPFVRIARAKRVNVRFDTPMMYELDGGSRDKVTQLKVRVVAKAITVCVPGVDPTETTSSTDTTDTAEITAHE